MVTISAGTLLAGIAMMLLTRDTIRRLSLELAGYQAVNWVAPQWGPIVIFLVLLLAAVGTVIWMTRALATGSGAARGRPGPAGNRDILSAIPAAAIDTRS